MASLRKFADRMRKLGQTIERNADQAVRTCALAVDATVVLATPVDTGRARGNWQVDVNAPILTTTGRTSVSGSEAIEGAKAAIANYKGGTPDAAVHITNNLPYIGRLNEGHSAQAPAGFVEEAILVGVQAIKNFSIVRESK